MKKPFQSLFSKTKENTKKKVSKVKVSATIFALLCSSMLVMSEKEIAAEEPNYQGSSFETGAYQHEAPAPYGLNYSQNSPYASTNTNTINWIYSLGYYEPEGNDIKHFWGKPAIDKDGTLYMNNYNGYIYAFNRDGTVKWKIPSEKSNFRTNIIGSDGTIYNSFRNLRAINPDGTDKWVAYASDPKNTRFNEPVIDKDGTIYVINDLPQSDTRLYAFNPDGSLKFKGPDLSKFGQTINGENGMLLGKNGYLYTLMEYNSKKFVVALDKVGNVVWSKEFRDTIKFAMDHKGDLIVVGKGLTSGLFAITKFNGMTGDILIEKNIKSMGDSPIIDYTNGDVYLNYDFHLVKYDNNLNELWKKPYYKFEETEVAIDKNRDIVFVNGTGVYKLNKDGEEIWKLDAKNLTNSINLYIGWHSPVIDKEGKIYFYYSSTDKNSKMYYNLISIGDPVESPIDFCSYYGSLEKKLNEKTLTKEEQNKAIQQTENLLNRLKSYSAE